MLTTIAGGGVIAAMIGFWKQIQGFLLKIISILIKTDTIKVNEDYWSLAVEEIFTKSKALTFGNEEYVPYSSTIYDKKNKMFRSPIFKSPKDGLYLFNKSLIYVNFKKLSISYIRGTFDTDLFLSNIINNYIEIITGMTKKHEDDRFYVKYIQGKSKKDIFNNKNTPQNGESLTNFLPKDSNSTKTIWETFYSANLLKVLPLIGIKPEDMGEISVNQRDKFLFSVNANRLFNIVLTWKNNCSWFKERQIQHKSGALVYGPPGSGKTQTIREICKKTGVPVFVFDIASMDNQEFHKEINGVNSPAIVLIEDIDTVFEMRKNIIDEENGLTFDCLINHISGINPVQGIFFIVTTNNIEKLDLALIRPGRLDHKIEIGELSEECKRYTATNILADYPEEAESLIKNQNLKYAAEFESACINLALEKFWHNNSKNT